LLLSVFDFILRLLINLHDPPGDDLIAPPKEINTGSRDIYQHFWLHLARALFTFKVLEQLAVAVEMPFCPAIPGDNKPVPPIAVDRFVWGELKVGALVRLRLRKDAAKSLSSPFVLCFYAAEQSRASVRLMKDQNRRGGVMPLLPPGDHPAVLVAGRANFQARRPVHRRPDAFQRKDGSDITRPVLAEPPGLVNPVPTGQREAG
jgi:hypothetical protein